MNNRVFICLGCTALLQVAGTAAQLNGVDDFNDNLRDAAKWGGSDFTLFNGQLTEKSGRLEYSVLESASFFDFARRSWSLNAGACTNDWIARVKLRVPDLVLGDGQEVFFELGAHRSGAETSQLGVKLRLHRTAGVTSREFQGTIDTRGIPLPGRTAVVPRSGIIGWVQLRFQAATKVMTLQYGEGDALPETWSTLTSYDLDDSEIDWQMTGADTFVVTLSGVSFEYRVDAQHEMWADDFLAASLPVITMHPQHVAVGVLEPVTFAVVAEAGPLAAFQWWHGGGILDGEESDSLTILSVTQGDAGDYQVVVTNAAGSVVSRPASLTLCLEEPYLVGELTAMGFQVTWAACGLEEYFLQQRASLAAGRWENVPKPYPKVNGAFQMTFPPAGSAKYFQLQKP